MKQYISFSEEETRKIAQKLGKEIRSGVVALTGELGAGKTTFAAGFAKGLGVKNKIISPTFILIRQYKIPKTNRFFYHIDLYRLDNLEDLKSIGIDEILSDQKNLVLIEWAEKLNNLPPNSVKINFEKIEGDKRIIKVY